MGTEAGACTLPRCAASGPGDWLRGAHEAWRKRHRSSYFQYFEIKKKFIHIDFFYLQNKRGMLHAFYLKYQDCYNHYTALEPLMTNINSTG